MSRTKRCVFEALTCAISIYRGELTAVPDELRHLLFSEQMGRTGVAWMQLSQESRFVRFRSQKHNNCLGISNICPTTAVSKMFKPASSGVKSISIFWLTLTHQWSSYRVWTTWTTGLFTAAVGLCYWSIAGRFVRLGMQVYIGAVLHRWNGLLQVNPDATFGKRHPLESSGLFLRRDCTFNTTDKQYKIIIIEKKTGQTWQCYSVAPLRTMFHVNSLSP